MIIRTTHLRFFLWVGIFCFLFFSSKEVNAEATVLKGIVFQTPNSRAVEEDNLKGIRVECVTLPTSFPLFKRYISCYLGQPLNEELLCQLKDAVIVYYQHFSHPFVIIT